MRGDSRAPTVCTRCGFLTCGAAHHRVERAECPQGHGPHKKGDLARRHGKTCVETHRVRTTTTPTTTTTTLRSHFGSSCPLRIKRAVTQSVVLSRRVWRWFFGHDGEWCVCCPFCAPFRCPQLRSCLDVLSASGSCGQGLPSILDRDAAMMAATLCRVKRGLPLLEVGPLVCFQDFVAELIAAAGFCPVLG